MSASPRYFSSIAVSVASFVAQKGLGRVDAAKLGALMAEFVRQQPNSNNWLPQSWQAFATEQNAAAPELALGAEFLQQHPPFQASVWLHEFLLALNTQGCSSATIRNYRSDISQFFQFTGEVEPAAALTKPQLARFVSFQEQKGLKPSSITRKLKSLKQFGEWLSDELIVPALPETLFVLENLHITADQNLEVPAFTSPSNTPVSAAVSVPTQTVPKAERAIAHQEFRAQFHHQLQQLATKVRKQSRQLALTYLNLALIVLFFLGLGVFGYQQFFQNVPNPLAYPSTPTRPNRVLSFQGRLTDAALNPITTSRNFVFDLYDSGPGTGGSNNLLWTSGTCAVTPDQDGIFSVGLGSDCGSEITEGVFSENANVWLEVEVQAEVLTPRQPIRTVAYALNAETLQGYPITASGAATVNTVVTMNSSGQVVLGEVSPKIKSVSGTFYIEGQTIQLQTPSGSNGDVIIDADGTGKLDIRDYLKAPGATFSATYAGGVPLTAKGGPSGTANILNLQDSSSNTLAYVDSAGNLTLNTQNDLRLADVDSTNYVALQAPSVVSSNLTYTLPGSVTDGYVLQTNGSGTLTWADPTVLAGTATLWTSNLGSIVPKNSTMDLLVGGQTTASAKFAFVNNNAGTPTATISGNFSLQVPTGSAPAASLNILNGGTLSIRGTSAAGMGDAGLGTVALFGNRNVTLYGNRTGGNGLARALVTQPGTGAALVHINPDNIGLADTFSLFQVDGGSGDNLFNVYGNGRDLVAVGPYSTANDYLFGVFNITASEVATRIRGAASQTGNLTSWENSSGTPLSVVTASGAFGIGDSTPDSMLEVLATTEQLRLTHTDGTADARFTVDSGGDLTIVPSGSELNVTGNLDTSGTFTAGSSNAFQIDSSGRITSIDAVAHTIDDVAGDLTLTSNSSVISLNDSVTFASTTTLNGQTYTWPASITNGYVLQTNGSGTLTWADPAALAGASVYWNQANGALFPKNSTVDMLVGGQTTASAKFAVLNMNGGTPTASISANSGNNALYLTGDGTLAATNRSDVTIGNSTTYNTSGDVLLNPNGTGRVGIGTTSPTAPLHLSYSGSTNPARFVRTDTGPNYLLIEQANNANNSDAVGINFLQGTNNAYLTWGGSTDSLQLYVAGASAPALTVLPDGSNNGTGNFGISDTTPDYLLELHDSTNTPTFALSDDDIAHGLTTLAQTDIFSHMTSLSTTAGGAQWTAISDTDAQALSIRGVIGSTDPTDTTPAIKFVGAKSNGSTGMADLTATETVFQVANNDDTAALTILGSGNVGIGDTTPASLLSVGNGDLFQVNSSGRIVAIDGVAHTIDDVTGDLTLTSNSSVISLNDSVTFASTTTLNGQTYTWPASITNGYVLQTNGSGTLTWADPAALAGASVYWTQALGSLYPKNSTVDMLVGGQTTASAKFAVLNMNTGTPVASISANSGNNALYLTGDGTLAATNRSDVTIGNSTTYNTSGDVLLNPNGTGNVGIGTTSPASPLHVAGTGRLSFMKGAGTSGWTYNAIQNNGSSDLNYGVVNSAGAGYYTLANNEGFMFSDVTSLMLGGSSYVRFVTNGTEKARIDTNGNLGIGDTSPDAKLEVLATTEQLRLTHTDGSADTSFTVDSGGDLTIAPSGSDINITGNLTTTGDVTVNGDDIFGDSNLSISAAGYVRIGDSGTPGVATGDDDLYVLSDVELDGNLIVAGTTSFNGVTYTWPASDGSANQVLSTDSAGQLSWQTVATDASNMWTSNLGAIVPKNSTMDLLVGGQTTASAKFAFINVDSGTPTASISAGAAGGVYLTATGTLQTTADQTLTLGGNTTGAVVIDDNTYLGSLANGLNITTAGVISDVNANVIINDVVDLGSATTGINISTAGLITDTDGNVVIGDTVDLGSATTGINITTAGVITDTNGNVVIDDVVDLGSVADGINITIGGVISDNNANVLINDSVDITGSLSTTGDVAVNGDDITSDSNLTINATGYVRIGDSGTPGVANGNDDLYVTSDVEMDGNLIVAGTTSFNGVTYTWPGADGSSGQVLSTDSAGQLSWQTVALDASNMWTSNLGAIVPKNSTMDLLVGGQTTASAKFAFINVNSGTPTASMSAGTAGGAYLTATGLLQTTADQTLTLGGDTTGAVVINDNTYIGSLANGLNITTAGIISDVNANVVINDVVDLGSATTGINVSTAGLITDTDGNVVIGDVVDLGSATTGINITTAGLITDTDGNVVIGDVVDLGSATTGINITTAGLITDTDGNVVIGDVVDLGSATTGINITTAGLISDTDGNVIIGDTVDLGSAANGINITTAGVISDNNGNVSIADTLDVTGDITATGDLAVNGDDITSDGTLTINVNNSYVRIGDTGTPNFANGDDDLYVEGDLEIDGNLYVGDKQITNNSLWLNDLNVYHPGYEYADVADLVLGGTSTASANVQFSSQGWGVLDGARTGKAQIIINSTGDQNIIAASQSGSSVFRVSNSGDVRAPRFIDLDNSSDAYYLDPAHSSISMVLANDAALGTLTPSARIHAVKTTEQLRLGYDTSNYASFTVGSTGNLTLDLTGSAGTLTTMLTDLALAGDGDGASGGSVGDLLIGDGQDLELYHTGSVSVIKNNTGNLEINGVASSGVVVNENGEDIDFRIESDDQSNMFHLDADNNGIGIGTTGTATSQVTLLHSRTSTANGGTLTITSDQTQAGTFTFRPVQLTASNQSAGSVTGMTGLDIGINTSVAGSSTSTVQGINVRSTIDASTTFTSLKMINIEAPSNSGTLTNWWGLWGDAGDWVLDEDGGGTSGGNATGGDLFLGEDQDLELYHNGTDSFVLSNTNDLYLGGDSGSGGSQIQFGDEGATNVYGFFITGSTNTGDFGVDTNTLYVDASANSVGIGTTAPSQNLSVIETNATAGTVGITARFSSDTIASNETMFNITTDDASAANEYFMAMQSEVDSVTDNEFLFQTAGTALADGAFTGGGADVAELYYVSNSVEPGDLVAIDPAVVSNHGKTVRKATGLAYDSQVLGVVSTNPGLVAGYGDNDAINPENDPREPIALAGRVPVKVSLENGPIAPGDPLTSSSIPGVAMKASAEGAIVGYALESYDGSTTVSAGVQLAETEYYALSPDQEPIPAPSAGLGKIMLFVNTSWYSPVAQLNQEGFLVITNDSNGQPSYSVETASGSLINAIASFARVVVAQLEAGLISTRELIAAVSITAPQVETDMITPLVGNDVTVKLGDSTPTNPAAFQVTDAANQPVFQVESTGDASLSGELTANSARLQELEARVAEFSDLKAQTAVLGDATVSGTLYADDIAGFEDKVANSLKQPSLLQQLMAEDPEGDATTSAAMAKLFQVMNDTGMSASGAASLNQSLADLNLTDADISISASAAFIDSYFEVNGNAFVGGSLGVAQNLLVGDGLSISNSGITQQATAANPEGTLYLQANGQGRIDLLAGAMTVDANGNVSIKGSLAVEENVTVGGTLLTDLLKPTSYNQAVQLQVAGVSTESGQVVNSRFEIVNELGAPVATVSADGRAEFAGGITVGNQTSGKAAVPASGTEITISSTKITPGTLIYVTPVGSTGNQVLYVKSQTADDPQTPANEGQFVVGFDNATTSEVQFNWWLVN